MKREYTNIWRILITIILVSILIAVIYPLLTSIDTTPKQETPYPFQYIIDNNNYYIQINNKNISDFTERVLATHYNTSQANITKTLNETNAIYLYHFVRDQFGFCRSRHPVEVLEQRCGELTSLHALFSSMLNTLDGEGQSYLFLYDTSQGNRSSTLLLLDKTYFFNLQSDVLIYNTSFDIFNLKTDIYLPDVSYRYIVGPEEVTYINRDVDLYLWLKEKRGE